MTRPICTALVAALMVAGLLAMGLPAQAQLPASIPLAPDAPFTVAVSTTTIEGGPVYVADEGPGGEGFRVINGGVRNLLNGGAHAATNAETQMLLVGAANPNVRLLFTVAEGLYRIVARRSSGIRALADLRGKRITTPVNTSAYYYLVRMLESAGLTESDVTIIETPRDGMAAAVIKGNADAIAMWEPESQKAVEGLGGDAVVFQDNRLYRELFSLYSTTDVMSDPKRRPELIAFVRALLAATAAVKERPRQYFPVIARVTNHPEEWVAKSWEHHRFPVAMPADMLDVMVREDAWLARNQKRAPRTREQLASYLDTSILAEARR
jgi:NitT/TauT family transport system substrate-binding protein